MYLRHNGTQEFLGDLRDISQSTVSRIVTTLVPICLSARKGTLRVHGKGATLRELPIHPQLRTDLQHWLDESPDWPGAQTTPALLLNRRGTRLSTRGASTIFRTIAQAASLDDTITAHTGRHTFATTLIRGGADLVTVAEMLGHARLDTIRAYTRQGSGIASGERETAGHQVNVVPEWRLGSVHDSCLTRASRHVIPSDARYARQKG